MQVRFSYESREYRYKFNKVYLDTKIFARFAVTSSFPRQTAQAGELQGDGFPDSTGCAGNDCDHTYSVCFAQPNTGSFAKIATISGVANNNVKPLPVVGVLGALIGNDYSFLRLSPGTQMQRKPLRMGQTIDPKTIGQGCIGRLDRCMSKGAAGKDNHENQCKEQRC